MSFPLALLAAAASPPAPAPAPAPAPIELRIELSNNHVLVPVRVRDRDLWFILDTGASTSMLDLGTARELGIPLGPPFEVRGAGAGGVEAAPFAQPFPVAIGGVAAAMQPVVAAMELSGLWPQEGRRMEGILGADFIRRFVVELDYRNRRMRLHHPAEFSYTGAGKSVPLSFRIEHPHLIADVVLPDGRAVPVDFVLDVGSSLTLGLTRPVVEQNRLMELLRPTVLRTQGGGIGGRTHSWSSRLSEFRLGEFVLKRPVVELFGEGAGVMSTGQYFEGNLGGGVLRRFTVFLDYGRSRVILEPNADFGLPSETDMSGISLRAEGTALDRIGVIEVAPDSPAAQAGVLAGDQLLSVDGRVASELGLDALRALFREPDRSYSIRVRRSGREMTLTLVTRRMV